MKLSNLLAVTAGVAMLAASCSTPKDITYMQGFSNGMAQEVRAQSRITVQPDDRLGIYVSSNNPDLAQVFNLAIPQQRIGQSASASSNNMASAAYTVTPDGYINYPILGEIRVLGLTRHEVASMIQDKLVSGKHLNDAVVTVDFLNATVSVLGDVNSPGEYPIDKDDMNVLQVISKAGDLNITGERTNVLVVREEGGRDVAYRLDLTDTESLMQSPAFYLRQNDIVYIEPNNVKKRQATVNGNTVLTPSFWLSVASFLTTIAVLIIK
ncbi:MAG: polysaccharide biosynthesis/export family protein [Muribaculaceae bacterium]|nr:polysaccharide biosynthesis/export family protein [Muribaculaceae bacterium]